MSNLPDDSPAPTPRAEQIDWQLLGAAQSSLAYLVFLAQFEFMADAFEDADFAQLADGLINQELVPALDLPHTDRAAHGERLLARLADRAALIPLSEIVAGGSIKLPQNVLPVIRARIAANQPFDRLALGVAGWMRYVMGIDENGDSIAVKDPLAMRMLAIAAGAGDDPEALFDGLTALTQVFGAELPENPLFRDTVIDHLESLFEIGVAETVAQVAAL